ncbi:MAG: Asp-tRNA(Asn)/Glu-tRNA(Gln) amidotransferase subunit GatA [Candidatus Omnitrophota bacterium]
MAKNELFRLTAREIRNKYESGETTPNEVLESVIGRIESVDPAVRATVLVNKGSARAQAERLSGRSTRGRLYGIPIIVKDNICVMNEATTCASKILKGFKPPYSATVIEKLKAEDAIVIGKANMDEFAFGSSCETSCYGPTRNPWDTERAPGGSSGGSAAAIASDQAVMALGSDTGGSIRQPASLCGVVGVKPTYGRVSRYGLIAFASSLDQIGPLTKDVADAATVLGVIAGYDARDSTSVDVPVPDYNAALTGDIKGLRVGVPKEYFIEGVEPEVTEHTKKAIDRLGELGAVVSEISLPHTEYAVSAYYIIAPAEASSNLARYDGAQYAFRAKNSNDVIGMYTATRSLGFGDEAKRRILLGTYVLSSGYYEAYYLKAQKVRTKICRDFDEAFRNVDCIAAPTSPTTAFPLGERMQDPLSMYLSDVFTIPANLAGIPGISVPCGFSKRGLPVGLQVLAKPFDEETMLKVAHAYEQSAAWRAKRPLLERA